MNLVIDKKALARRLAITLGLLVLIFLAAWRCGSDSKNKNSDSGTPIQTPGFVPPAWDGETDWQGSAWEIIEE